MNLTKQQILAITDKFYSEIKLKVDKENKESKNKQLLKYKPLYDKGIKILKDNKFINNICIKIENYKTDLIRTQSFNSWTDSYNFNYLIDKKKKVLIEDIKNDVILATIDSKSMEDILKTLKTKYK